MTLNEMFGEKAQLLEKEPEDSQMMSFFSLLVFIPVGRVKKLKEAGSRGIKVIRDIVDELMGKGKKVSGEVPVSKDPFRLLPKNKTQV